MRAQLEVWGCRQTPCPARQSAATPFPPALPHATAAAPLPRAGTAVMSNMICEGHRRERAVCSSPGPPPYPAATQRLGSRRPGLSPPHTHPVAVSGASRLARERGSQQRVPLPGARTLTKDPRSITTSQSPRTSSPCRVLEYGRALDALGLPPRLIPLVHARRWSAAPASMQRGRLRPHMLPDSRLGGRWAQGELFLTAAAGVDRCVVALEPPRHARDTSVCV